MKYNKYNHVEENSKASLASEMDSINDADRRLKIFDYLSAVRIKNTNVNAMSSVKGGVWWVKIIIRLLQPIGLSVTGPRVHAIVILLRKNYKIVRKQGIKGLVIHLKACSVCFVQALGTHKIKDTGRLKARVSRTNLGLPRFILAADRVRIRNGDVALMRFYNSFFAIYRVLDFTGVLNTDSIVLPFTGNEERSRSLLIYVKPFIECLNIAKIFGADRLIRKNYIGDVIYPTYQEVYGQFWKQFVPEFPALKWLENEYSNRLDLWIAKSAPGTSRKGAQVSTHPMVMIRQAVSIAKSDIYPYFKVFLAMLPPNHILKWAFDASLKLDGVVKPVYALGKIGIKEEAAGKVRLFAMVTAWYQMILHPVHKLMFKILRTIPQDGTFDQLRPLKLHSERYTEAYSLDLTAATDRLPLFIQQEIVKALIGAPLAEAWGAILVNIQYHLYSLKFGTNSMLKYAIGQPMGALSSWASLALTHHFLVQVSAWKSGAAPTGRWFADYAILGDDLVIFNRIVANEYLAILKDIGMEVGLHKSILSRNSNALTVEFAKRVFHNGIDISPVPILEFTASLFDYGRLVEFARKYGLTTIQIAKLLGFRYQALAKIQSQQFSKLNFKLKMLLVALSVPTTEENAVSLLELGAPPVPNTRIAVGEILKTFTTTEIGKLLLKLAKLEKSQREDMSPFWNLNSKLAETLALKEGPEEGPLAGFGGHISDRLSCYLEPMDGHKWIGVPNETLYSPAELKEIGKGWTAYVDIQDVTVSQPMRYHGFSDAYIKEARSELKRSIVEHLIPVDLVRDALRHYVDLLTIPPRGDTLDLIRDLNAKVLDPRASPATIAAALVLVIENSREVALTPSVTADLVRRSPSAMPSVSISTKLWKRWTPLIQGAVSLDTFLTENRKK